MTAADARANNYIQAKTFNPLMSHTEAEMKSLIPIKSTYACASNFKRIERRKKMKLFEESKMFLSS